MNTAHTPPQRQSQPQKCYLPIRVRHLQPLSEVKNVIHSDFGGKNTVIDVGVESGTAPFTLLPLCRNDLMCAGIAVTY